MTIFGPRGPPVLETFASLAVSWGESAAIALSRATSRVVPVASARTLYEAVGSPAKQLRIFTAADGATYHAQADNRAVAVDYIADWIAGVVTPARPG